MPKTRATGQPAPLSLSVTPGDARRELEAILQGTRWCRHADTVVLAVHEALTNADRHGGGVLRVEAMIDQGVLVVAVCDRGPGFALSDQVEADPLAEHGRGLCLMNQIASGVEAGRDDGDFCLRLRFAPP
ncbi:MAG: Histidine kinaselike ATPase domain [Actinomycetota bacterium]|nr:Histidine kinaselike ATPase domain [Actinomycetota bacterium]